MKKFGLTLIEVLVAISLITVLSGIICRNLGYFLKGDTNLFKFKQVLGTVSEVVNRLSNEHYYGYDFSDTRSVNYINKVFEGKNKFRKLFKTYFNVNITKAKTEQIFGNNSIGKVPIYSCSVENSNGDKEEKITAVDFSELDCFTDNKSITYCMGDTPVPPPEQPPCSNLHIFLRVYLNPIIKDDVSTFENKKALYFKIASNGKIEIPPTISNGQDKIINCRTRRNEGFNEYTQCMARERATETEVTVRKRK